ncbi:nitroreductase [Candidatus Woesearchaeota archaeon]|nr:nitroreductase [Candidatus Woesearchaeota archaeon]|tara:strand:- start:1764 stop:2408 length:645 start_codon:yes stop_codon:yes gene_type:complete
MDILSLIKSRRSVRRFSQKEIPKHIIEKIIEAAIWAPSACDNQGWRFIIIDDDKVKHEIVNKGAASFIRDAPLGILVLYNNQTGNIEYKDHIQSAAASIQNILLAAHSFNLGGCWICHLPTKAEMRRILKIPHHYDPMAYIALGYYDAEPKPRPRKHELKDVLSYNRYRFNEKVPSRLGLRLMIKRVLRACYYRIPFRRHIKPLVDKLFEKRFD